MFAYVTSQYFTVISIRLSVINIKLIRSSFSSSAYLTLYGIPLVLKVVIRVPVGV